MRSTLFALIPTGQSIKFRLQTRPLALALAATGALLAASASYAAGDTLSEARARFNQDRAHCMSGASNQDRATCMIEARAALREASLGRLTDSSAGQKNQNNTSRCDALPSADRDDCMRRMRGEGVTSGTAADGGIYREITTPAAPR